MENWRPGADGFVASTDLDVFAVVTQPLDLFTRGGRKAQARGESGEAVGRPAPGRAGRAARRPSAATSRPGAAATSWRRSRPRPRTSPASSPRWRSGSAEGYAAEADLLRFRAEAARAANHLARARIERERAEAELAFLVGRPVAGARLEKPDLPPPPGGEPEALAEQAIVHRRDVAAARARAARARGTMSLEQARRYPDLALAGGYKRTTGLDTAVVGLVATVPVFERNGRAVARAEADARAADLELEATLTRARADAAILVRAARELQQRLARLDEDLVRPAEAARRSALAAFREGAADVLRVVDAERTNTEARREALDLTVEAFLVHRPCPPGRGLGGPAMSHPHDPVHAPEHHGLGPVRGGRLLVLVVAAVALVAVVAVWQVAGRGGPEAQAPTAAEGTVSLGEAAQKQAGIATAVVKRLTRSDRVEAPGILALDETRTARIGSLVEGDVVRILSEVGSRVGKGAVLAELNSRVVHDAWADYRKAVADRRRRETELAWARQAAERAGRLHAAEGALAPGAAARRDRPGGRGEQLDQARTEVRRAEEALEHLGVTNKEDPTGERGESVPVRAPLAGVVLEKYVTAGTAVTPGTPLFVVSDLTELWALAEVDETRIPLVAAGRPTELHVSAWPDGTFDGR